MFDNGARHRAAVSPSARARSRSGSTTGQDRDARQRVHQPPRRCPRRARATSQRLANGDDFVGYGSSRWFTEFSPAGALLLDGTLAAGNTSYRAYRLPWTGRPAAPPRLAARLQARPGEGERELERRHRVARWHLLAGAAQRDDPRRHGAADGFETTITIATSQPLVAMRALDAAGKPLASSAAVKPSAG